MKPNSRVTVVMYHYVREIVRSRYPRIKGLEVELFKKQLGYISKQYTVIRMEDILLAGQGTKVLPENALLLTFDDGYKDHFDYVFPILRDRGWQGSFFPPAKVIEEHVVLDVNKIHFILASVPHTRPLVEDIYSHLDHYREEFKLESNEHYYRTLGIESRMDTAEVIFIKRLLQRALPQALRSRIVGELFSTYVSNDEASFSRELYMSVDQLKEMLNAGMSIGGHSYDHLWLNTLSPTQQETDIKRSIAFLEKIGVSRCGWTMCYPYGGYDPSLTLLLKRYGCAVAFTTEVRIADLSVDSPLTLPRLDTNDLPKNEKAEPNEWTKKVLSEK
ncbi:MAG: polysaccharide deacetylase family protein [bacterium]|nr:polysaccharide deacetylase family protein [bacterium]